MLSHYKDSLHGVSDPVARVLLRARVRPNQLTVLGLGVSMLAGNAFFNGRFRLAAAFLTVAGLFDFFDGALARLAGRESASAVEEIEQAGHGEERCGQPEPAVE